MYLVYWYRKDILVLQGWGVFRQLCLGIGCDPRYQERHPLHLQGRRPRLLWPLTDLRPPCVLTLVVVFAMIRWRRRSWSRSSLRCLCWCWRRAKWRRGSGSGSWRGCRASWPRTCWRTDRSMSCMRPTMPRCPSSRPHCPPLCWVSNNFY